MNVSTCVCAILVVANFVNFISVDAKLPSIKSTVIPLTKQTSQDEGKALETANRNLIADEYKTVLCEVDSRGHDPLLQTVFPEQKTQKRLAIIDDAETFFLSNVMSDYPAFDGSDANKEGVGMLSVFKKGNEKYEVAEQVFGTTDKGAKMQHFLWLFYAETKGVLFAKSRESGPDHKFAILEKNNSGSWAISHEESLTECGVFAVSSNGRYAVCRRAIGEPKGKMEIFYAANSDLTDWESYEVEGERDSTYQDGTTTDHFMSFAFSDDGTRLVTSFYEWNQIMLNGKIWYYSIDGPNTQFQILGGKEGSSNERLGIQVRMSGDGKKVCASNMGSFNCYDVDPSDGTMTPILPTFSPPIDGFLNKWALTPDGTKLVVFTQGYDAWKYYALTPKKYSNGNGRVEVFEFRGEWVVTQTLLYPGGYVDQLVVTDKVIAYSSINCWGGMVRVYSSAIDKACDLPSACSNFPSMKPSQPPSKKPSEHPSLMPSDKPSETPSLKPSTVPSLMPSDKPSETPSLKPSTVPSLMPSSKPSVVPSMAPSMSFSPSLTPSSCCSGIFSFLGLFGM